MMPEHRPSFPLLRRLGLAVAVSLSILAATPAQAKLAVDITKGTANPIPIAITAL